MAKNFIKGTFELEKNVVDLDVFEAKIEKQLKEIANWANVNKVSLRVGTSEDYTYLCEFYATARTKQMCDGYVAELKAMWREIFPKTRLLYQASVDTL